MDNLGLRLTKDLLKISRNVCTSSVRNNNRINVGKPRPSHYNRAKIEHLVKPRFFEKGERDSWSLPSPSQCLKQDQKELKLKDSVEENPYERLLAKELRNWFQHSKLIAFFHSNPVRFDDRFETEVRFRKENMYLKKYGKHTVNMALEGTPYMPVMSLFASHTEIVFCSEPKVDRLMKVVKKTPFHFLLAAIVEDRLLSVSQLSQLSQLKDLTTARAQLAGVLNSAQSQMVRSLTFHQSNIVSGLQLYADQPASKTEDTDKPASTTEDSN